MANAFTRSSGSIYSVPPARPAPAAAGFSFVVAFDRHKSERVVMPDTRIMPDYTKQQMSKPEIEGLVINADDGELFGGLRRREANAFQQIAWNNGRGVRIDVDDATTGTYRAVVVV
jgi:hypothetical protein